jgi:hypothetical protein
VRGGVVHGKHGPYPVLALNGKTLTTGSPRCNYKSGAFKINTGHSTY